MITLQNENSSAFSVSYVSAGLFVTHESWVHPSRNLDSYEIIYVVEGELFLREEQRRFALTKGDVLLLRAGATHSGYKESTGATSFYWGHFTTDDFAQLKIEEQALCGGESFRILELFSQLLHCANTMAYPAYTKDLLITLIVNELALRQNGKAQKRLTGEVMEWVRLHASEDICAQDVSDWFGYNRDYLSCIFKKAFGVGLSRFINNQRMSLAKSMLLSTNSAIKEIAAELGCKSENHFTNFFKYHEKMSPAAFRNIYTKTHLNNR